MSVDIRLIGYDYTNNEHKYVAIDPATKAILVKDIYPDHGELTGLGDDDHVHYYNQARGDARYLRLAGGTMTGLLTLSGAPTADLHASTKKYVNDHAAAALSQLTIDVNKDWNAKNITNMGTIEHKGATLKSGIQAEGRCSAGIIDPDTNYGGGDDFGAQAVFREKMTNTPSSITLSNAAETTEVRISSVNATLITIFGFLFEAVTSGGGRSFYSNSKKYVTVGN